MWVIIISRVYAGSLSSAAQWDVQELSIVYSGEVLFAPHLDRSAPGVTSGSLSKPCSFLNMPQEEVAHQDFYRTLVYLCVALREGQAAGQVPSSWSSLIKPVSFPAPSHHSLPLRSNLLSIRLSPWLPLPSLSLVRTSRPTASGEPYLGSDTSTVLYKTSLF